ncbi:hypothetical protein [Nocardia sp. NRRL S-836]|uniref:hypothetical protein n=1 Tax=Nocardia sp. NRRL S-836 TaxID=1519492 RepID=UPI0006AE384D|nr:hypothetical protein [Nocardia sp. NRRL S-836]KOV78502.1 hypothetical protein ADL03_39980 [Nocardia sp. NRRL S-836]
MTSMVFALRAQLRRTVRQSVRRSFTTAVPVIPRGQDWARWADFLTQDVVQPLLTEITAPGWLHTWLPQASPAGNNTPAGDDTPAGNNTPAGTPPGGSDKPSADTSRQLSVATLLDMMIRKQGQYLVHRTFNRAVGELWEGTVIDAGYPAGTLDPNAPPGIYAVPGLVGVEYGSWCVIFKKGAPGHYFTSVAVTADAKNTNKDEMICIRDIETSAAHGWCTVEDVLEAKKQYDAHKKAAGTSKQK